MSKKNVAIITHTGSDMPLAEAECLGVIVVPDRVLFGDETYRNLVDITADAFYEKMNASATLPTSSRPPVGDFLKAIRQGAEMANEVLCLMITSKMSATFESAKAAAGTAKRQGMEVPVYVYDTCQCSHGMAIMVRTAVELANEGYGAEDIMKELDELQKQIGVYVVLDSLKNAKKGGRVGAVTAFTADALGLKPVLCFTDGLVRDFAVKRNFDEGMNAVLKQFCLEGDPEKEITVFHGAAPERAEVLKNKILEHAPHGKVRIEAVGPVIGIYSGAGCVGMAFTKKESL